MAFWGVRAGRHGQNEEYALNSNVILIGWESLGNVEKTKSREEIQLLMEKTYPDESEARLRIWTGEVWAFKERIAIGDLVCIPLKTRSALAFGEIVSDYRFDPNAPDDAKHQRKVRWIKTDVPRKAIDQDILYSLGSILAVFQVSRNNAEQRIKDFLQNGTRASGNDLDAEGEDPAKAESFADIEQFAADQITNYISRKFRGHEFTQLVASILSAQGYKVFVSPPGADGGVDILAGSGPMGFDEPRLAVQVKSGDSPSDVSVLRELQGVIPRFGASLGLIVSWGGFKNSVIREARQLHFQMRLWDAGDVVMALQTNYEKLPDDLQAEIPLKRIWSLVND